MLIRSAIVIVLFGIVISVRSQDEFGSGTRLLMKLYDDCQKKGFVPCLKMKAITFFDRAGRSNELNLGETVTIVRDTNVPISSAEVLTEKDLEETLPRGSEEARDSRLNAILFNRIADFFNSHKVMFNLPKLNPSEIQEGVEEGKGGSKLSLFFFFQSHFDK